MVWSIYVLQILSCIFVYAEKHLQVVPETLEPSLQLAAAVLAQVITLLWWSISGENRIDEVLYLSHNKRTPNLIFIHIFLLKYL